MRETQAGTSNSIRQAGRQAPLVTIVELNLLPDVLPNAVGPYAVHASRERVKSAYGGWMTHSL